MYLLVVTKYKDGISTLERNVQWSSKLFKIDESNIIKFVTSEDKLVGGDCV